MTVMSREASEMCERSGMDHTIADLNEFDAVQTSELGAIGRKNSFGLLY